MTQKLYITLSSAEARRLGSAKDTSGDGNSDQVNIFVNEADAIESAKEYAGDLSDERAHVWELHVVEKSTYKMAFLKE